MCGCGCVCFSVSWEKCQNVKMFQILKIREEKSKHINSIVCIFVQEEECKRWNKSGRKWWFEGKFIFRGQAIVCIKFVLLLLVYRVRDWLKKFVVCIVIHFVYHQKKLLLYLVSVFWYGWFCVCCDCCLIDQVINFRSIDKCHMHQKMFHCFGV